MHPLFQTSANLSGEPAPHRFETIPPRSWRSADLAIDGGELGGEPSTVVDVTAIEDGGGWKVLREGALPAAEVERLSRTDRGQPFAACATERTKSHGPLELGPGPRSIRSSASPWTPAMISSATAGTRGLRPSDAAARAARGAPRASPR